MNTEHDLKSLNELESQINLRISEFNKKRKENQRYNKIFSLGQILLSALTTLLIAVNLKVPLLLITIISLVTSSLASLAGQLLNNYMYQERMAMNITTVCALYELKYAITMDKRKEEDDKENYKITLKKIDSYQEQYQQILDTANRQWKKYIQKEKVTS